MVKIHTLADLENVRRSTGDQGIFVRHRNIRCGACHATVFVPSWPDGSAEPGEYVPAAWEKMHHQGGCPACHPELNWDISIP
jgi:hypothetical protein